MSHRLTAPTAPTAEPGDDSAIMRGLWAIAGLLKLLKEH